MKQKIITTKAIFIRASLIAITTCLLLGGGAQAQNDNTIRHTIIKDDTLWELSAKYLENPWLWPEVWKLNNHIENPNLIFPGDMLLISASEIRLLRNNLLDLKTNKLSPQVRSSPSHAITTIDPSVIMPFLNQSIIVEPELLASSAYVLQGQDDRIILGRNSRFYASGVEQSGATEYLLFSTGRIIEDKATDTEFGVEGIHLGIARLIEHEGDVALLEVARANQDIRPGDRLIPIDEPVELPHYFPHRPKTQINANIIAVPKGVDEAGRRDVVIISSGQQDGLEEGHVLEVFDHKGEIKDPVTGKLITLPDYKTGMAMVFRAYEQVSYALLMETTAPVKVGDRASSP